MSSSIADLIANPVAPLAGAWIEIYYPTTVITADGVAPLAGAWIEILSKFPHVAFPVASLPSRERGLKLLSPVPARKRLMSLPSRERGLK